MNENSQKVAVIMSVYKSDDPDALLDAFNSMLGQTYPCDIFIYRDGLIPKALGDVLEKIATFSNVSLVASEKNKGLAYALNVLIDKVMTKNYDFIARMDSDDISRINRVEMQVNYLNSNVDIDVCGTSCREFGASFALNEKHLPTTHDELLNFSITRCPLIHPTVMFRSTVFSSGVRYPTDTSFTEDMALWFALLERGYRFGNINEVLLDYRLNENTIYRRKGIHKALSEVKIRLTNMMVLKKVSFKNFGLILSRFVFHLMPAYLLRVAYKRMR